MYSIIAPYICEPFRERSKIGGSLLSSEGPAFEVYIDAAPRVATPFSTDLLKQEGRLENKFRTRPHAVQNRTHA